MASHPAGTSLAPIGSQSHRAKLLPAAIAVHRVVFIGPSNAGKSTTINIISGAKDGDEHFCESRLDIKSVTLVPKLVRAELRDTYGELVRVELVDTPGLPRDSGGRDAEHSGMAKAVAAGTYNDPRLKGTLLGSPATLVVVVLKMDRSTNGADYAVLAELIRHVPRERLLLFLVNPSRARPGDDGLEEEIKEERRFVKELMEDKPFMRCIVVGHKNDRQSSALIGPWLANYIKYMMAETGLTQEQATWPLRSYADVDAELADAVRSAQADARIKDQTAFVARLEGQLQDAYDRMQKAKKEANPELREKIRRTVIEGTAKACRAINAFLGIIEPIIDTLSGAPVTGIARRGLAWMAYCADKQMEGLYADQLKKALKEAEDRHDQVAIELDEAKHGLLTAMELGERRMQEAQEAVRAWEACKQHTAAATRR